MKHGANIYKYAKKIKCKPDEIIDFSSSINLYNPDINIDITPQMVTKYPDSKYKKLKKTISKKRYENIHQNVLEHFGKYAGYSQQFLYKMERDLNEKKWL